MGGDALIGTCFYPPPTCEHAQYYDYVVKPL